ncbi:MAG: fumarylacetoacetase [Paracoccaceae bacterium]
MSLMKSWVESANAATTDFPLNNLALGVFSIDDEEARCGVAIGDFILDVSGLEAEGLLTLGENPVFDVPFWNELMELGPDAWAEFRKLVAEFLNEGSPKQIVAENHLVRQADVVMHMPFLVSEYTDFYAGRNHAFNVGSMFRDPANALPPNWLHLPIGYNGRASSVVVSGTDVRRPWGQLKPADAPAPFFAPSKRFDFELEMAAIIGRASEGMVSVADADAMIFGYVLLNDWSARDIQAWEYQPLGPFQAKATATTISPWIVMKAALEPFRVETPARDVPLLAYLVEPAPMLYDIALEVGLTPRDGFETVLSRTNYSEMYYSAPQQLCHHTTSGCPMNAGDLLGSGTISGPDKSARGSLLELSWGGKEPLTLIGGEVRSFIEDGDTVTLRGAAIGEGYRIGFGECTGRVIAAHKDPIGAGR